MEYIQSYAAGVAKVVFKIPRIPWKIEHIQSRIAGVDKTAEGCEIVFRTRRMVSETVNIQFQAARVSKVKFKTHAMA